MSCPFIHFFHMFIRTPTIFLDSRINKTLKANLTIRFIMLGANREHSIMCKPITCLIEWMAILDTNRTMSSKSKMYDYIFIYISLHQSTDKCREMQTLVMVRLAHEPTTIWISHICSLQLIYGWQSNTFRTYNNNTHIFTLSFFLVILWFICVLGASTLGLH